MKKSKIIIAASAAIICTAGLAAASAVICRRLCEKHYFSVND